MIPSLNSLKGLLSDIRYKDWYFEADVCAVGSTLAYAIRACLTDEKGILWPCRWWVIPRDVGREQIIQTALKAVITAEEHEARERFLFQGRALYAPHHSIGDLARLTTSTPG